jgi:hypothetical protein
MLHFPKNITEKASPDALALRTPLKRSPTVTHSQSNRWTDPASKLNDPFP